MPQTTYTEEYKNTANGSEKPTTTSQTPSPGTTTRLTTNSPTFSALIATLSFHSTSKLFNCQTRFLVAVADLAAALAAHQTAVGGGTLKNKAQAWKRYTEYCNHVGLGHNPFLDRMSRQHKVEIMGAFAAALCQGQFSRAMLPWLTAQLEIPSTLWLQPSGTTEGRTPNKTRKITLHNFYGVS
jgi:hypothetical protein